MPKTSLLALALVLALPAGKARAAAETGAPLLTRVVDARAMGMGDIGVTDNSDPSTIFYNPANVVAGSRVYAIASEQRFHTDEALWIRRGRGGFSWRSQTTGWSLGADVTYAKWDYGETILVDTAGNVLATFHPYEEDIAAALGMGYRSAGGFEWRFGVGTKRWSASYGPAGYTSTETVHVLTYDLGTAAALHERYGAWNITPLIGAAIMDVGDDIKIGGLSSEPLPTRLNVGASVRLESSPCNVFSARVPLVTIVCQADGVAPEHGDFEWGIGNEIAIAQMLFLRTGVHRYLSNTTDTNPTYPSWGVGAGFPAGALRARFDWAHQANDSDRDHMSVLVELQF